MIAKRAKIGRSTFYRHHRAVREIMPDLEQEILETYARLMRGLIRREKVRVRTLYLQTLIFMHQNRRVLMILLQHGQNQVFERMVRVLRPRIRETQKIPKDGQLLMEVYEKEVAAVLEDWLRTGLKISEAEVLERVMFLTNTIKKRLKGLLGRKNGK